ncbi:MULTISPECIES: PD40 domain-containing protein [unclassified Fibrobacter]|uniref:TolB family protein n=1 Tax=unclassified Fibrobacter TaxID=2634177 RepID=UPI000D6DB647|nr:MULTISPECIES: PD40 domain-containing protein [unclassified Fibrobacter]PWJ71661.1 WD40 repeat protein [Fibrobacter sp. UWR4]PZW65105.1 WD40 repeat protein [Fibrobacter sp. UWR1]
MKMMKFARASLIAALACSSVFAQQGAPKGAAVDPTADEQKTLDALKGKVEGVIAWSTSRANSHHDIWLMNADGSNAHALTNSDNVDWFPRISPDGAKVLFNRSKGGWVPENDANYPEKWELWTMDIDGSNQTKVVDNATWGTWRPDGKTIVFSRAGKVFAMDLSSKAESMILDGEVAFNKKDVILQEPNMSPDGKHLAITLRGSMRETGVWDLEKKTWTKSGDGCQIDWNFDGSKLYRVNPTGNGGTAAPSEILWFSAKDGKQVEKVGFFGIPKNVRLMDLPGRRSHEYFPRLSPDGKWLVWGATDKGHDHDMFDYELYMWKIGEPVETAARITYHSGNDRWPDIWLGKVPVKAAPAAEAQAAAANAASAAVAGGASDAKMDELIKAIDRLTDAVNALTRTQMDKNMGAEGAEHIPAGVAEAK